MWNALHAILAPGMWQVYVLNNAPVECKRPCSYYF